MELSYAWFKAGVSVRMASETVWLSPYSIACHSSRTWGGILAQGAVVTWIRPSEEELRCRDRETPCPNHRSVWGRVRTVTHPASEARRTRIEPVVSHWRGGSREAEFAAHHCLGPDDACGDPLWGVRPAWMVRFGGCGHIHIHINGSHEVHATACCSEDFRGARQEVPDPGHCGRSWAGQL